jgi:predicted PurR-regulated permease PerM
LLLIVAISLAFAWILWPFYGAVLWGAVLAIVFAPLYRRLSRSMRQQRNRAALTTMMIVVVIVILPLTLIAACLVQEASGVYEKFQSGELNLARNFQQVVDALPTWVANLLDRFGLTNLAGGDRATTAIYWASIPPSAASTTKSAVEQRSI